MKGGIIMFYSPKQLIIHRLKKFGSLLIGGLLFGVAIIAIVLMMVSDEFTKIFMIISVIVGIIWWIADGIYWSVRIKKSEEARKAYEEYERKRRASLQASISVVPPRSPKVLFDYDKH